MAEQNEPSGRADPDAPLPDDGSTDEAYASAAAGAADAPDAAVIDDPDEPENPDEATRAETEAARAALAPRAPRRKYRGPQSILIMVVVVGAVIATGVYAVVRYQRMKEADDRGDLRGLEEREVMSKFQRRSILLKFGPDSNVLPAGTVYEPLTPLERGQMRLLQERFGAGQFKPSPQQDMLIQDVRDLEAARGLKQSSVQEALAKPATVPATAPAAAPTSRP